MKQIFILFSILTLAVSTSAQTKTKWFKAVRRAQAVCYTYKEDGTVAGRSNAVVLGEEGDVLTQYDILRNASRAEIITNDGKKYDVTAIVAANSLYNIAQLRSNCGMDGVRVAAKDAAMSSEVYVMPSTANSKQSLCKNMSVSQVEKINNGEHSYYSFTGQRFGDSDATLADIFTKAEEFLPVMNAEGELVAMTQHNSSAQEAEESLYGVSARYVMSCRPGSMNILSPDYLQLRLPILLPDDKQQAEAVLFLMPRTNALRYEQMVRQYIAKYPQAPFGYNTLAEFKAANGKNEEAQTVYDNALNEIAGDGRDEVLYSESKFLASDSATLDRAFDAVSQAIAINPQPVYRKHLADLMLARRRYDEARDIYVDLANTPLRSAEVFLSAAQCVPQTDSLYLALLDSAVNCYPTPYPTDALPVLWLRADARHNAQKYRLAVADYNDFEHLASGRVSAEFYYRRSESELAGRLYQLALDDAQRAVEKDGGNALYLIHLANIYIRVGQKDDAVPLLRKAADLGEPAAKEWLEKNVK
ncbi:MAG: tetratricopeptide repeat protein [Bacteroidaceae bacterium]|nr:tetratricopeptide repeat protein [Bacteroidaceae bacterium]